MFSRVDPIRVHSLLLGEKRQRALERLDAAKATMRDLDRQLDGLARQRREAAAEVRDLQARLWPTWIPRGRKPAPDGTERLPPAPAHAAPVWGRRLRAACRRILAAFAGPMELTELHARLHDEGHLIKSRHPVKALADAMGYELDLGRVRRVSRGVYQLVLLS